MNVPIDRPEQAGQVNPPAKMRFWATVPSPLGALLLLSDGTALTGLYMPANRCSPRIPASVHKDQAPFGEAIRQLRAYFGHELTAFDLPLAPRGTPFQLRVWQALLTIPYGQTKSYGQLAHLLGDPRAARAVGHANFKNPLALIVPCHRVIGSSGQLTGYAAGLERKRWLLAHEAALSAVTAPIAVPSAPPSAPRGAPR